MIKTIAFLSSDGGCAKTTSAHLLCLGAVWNAVEAAFIHTDNKAPITINRPYHYFDCRAPEQLVSKVNEILNSGIPGVVVIDGGAGRKGNDEWFSKKTNLIVIPVDLSQGGVREAISTSLLVTKNGVTLCLSYPIVQVKIPWERRTSGLLVRSLKTALWLQEYHLSRALGTWTKMM